MTSASETPLAFVRARDDSFDWTGGHRDRAGTSLNRAAGARSRLALVTASVVMAVVILAFAGLVGHIATLCLVGLLMLIGYRTVKSAGLLSVWKPSRCKRQYC